MLRIFLSLVCSGFLLSCSSDTKTKFVEIEAEHLDFSQIKRNVQWFLKNEKIQIPVNGKVIFWGDSDCVPCIQESYFNRISRTKGEITIFTSNQKLIEELKKEFNDLKVVKVRKSKLQYYQLNFSSPVIVTKKSKIEFQIRDL